MPDKISGNNKEIAFYPRHDLCTIFSDQLLLSSRSDGIFLLRFASFLPEGMVVEQARIAISNKHIQEVIKLLCRNADFYPEKEKPDVLPVGQAPKQQQRKKTARQ